MESDFRHRVIDKLRRGENLPTDWALSLFPPERQEYYLSYYGKEREEDIIADTMAVPLQRAAEFGGPPGDNWYNMLVFGDNLQVMKTLLEMKREGRLKNADGSSGVKLAYIDPPFATKRDFRGKRDQDAYRDKLAGADFLEFLRKRLILLRELLATNGSIYVHLDMKKGHYVKVLMDEIFGEGTLLNEIVWYYRNKLGTGGTLHDRRHDVLYWYRVGSSYVYHEQMQKVLVEKKQPVTQKVGGERIWLRDEAGKRRYEQGAEERPIGDVWEIPIINPVALERKNYDYPTQKPEALLARVIETSSDIGDIVLDAFAGSGTTAAVAEKMGRRWVAIDSGKLAIYTMQSRLLSLREKIGNATGKRLTPRAFALYNAGLYDFATLSRLPWADWRFFALRLFDCKDSPHTIGGLRLDGKRRGYSVLVFDHMSNPGKRVDEETIREIHSAIGSRISGRFFIIAPRGVFDFQQDYLDIEGVRYYALRIPYSVITELHRRQFAALEQPSEKEAINATVDAFGFDFIQPPSASWRAYTERRPGELFEDAVFEVLSFESKARIKSDELAEGFESFAMLMFDYDYDGSVFKLDSVHFGHELESNDWRVTLSHKTLGEQTMAIFMDVYGNEARVVIPNSGFNRRRKDARVGSV